MCAEYHIFDQCAIFYWVIFVVMVVFMGNL